MHRTLGARLLSADCPVNTFCSSSSRPLCSDKAAAALQCVGPPAVLPADLAGEERAMLHRMLRVDHAGGSGASHLYAGQMAVLGKTSARRLIQDMWDQEKGHLQMLDALLAEHRVRPTALLPLWNLAGFTLGVSSALLGRGGALACTAAVEESVSEHYNSQIRELMENHPDRYTELLNLIKELRDDEVVHLDTDLNHDAEAVPGLWLVKAVVHAGCKAAIYASERV